MMKKSEMTPEMLKELAFTQEEIDELNRSREMPITFDEDCPETTPERAVRFHRVNLPNRTVKGPDEMCEAIGRISAKWAEEAAIKDRYEIARLLWDKGELDYEKVSRIDRLALEQLREVISAHGAFKEPDAKLAVYARLVQAENDLKHGRTQNVDDALNDILSELNGLE